MKELTVTYKVSDDAPDWLFDCITDGDWGGVLEYVVNLYPDKVKLY